MHPLELSYDVDRDGDRRTNENLNTDNNKLNPEATEFWPKRRAAAIVELKFIDVIQKENEPPQVAWLKDIDKSADNKRFYEYIFNSCN